MQGYLGWSRRYLPGAVVPLVGLWLLFWQLVQSLGKSPHFLSPAEAAFLATMGTLGFCFQVGVLWLIGLALAYWGDVKRQTR